MILKSFLKRHKKVVKLNKKYERGQKKLLLNCFRFIEAFFTTSIKKQLKKKKF